MTLAHARALLHGRAVFVEPELPERDAEALAKLARWANRFAPTVAVDPPDGLMLDVTGCERLYGGEPHLLDGVRGAVARLGVRCRGAIAPTIGGAWAWARYGDPARPILQDGDLTHALAPLPIEALRLEPHVVEELASVGVRLVEHLLDLPRAQLADRFGDAVLRRIDQALRITTRDTGAGAGEALAPLRPAPPPEAERLFDGPCRQLEAIELATRGLAEALCASLRGRGLGVRRLRVRFDRSDAEPVAETLDLSAPSRDAKHLWTLLRPRVERMNLGFGVDAIRLTALEVGDVPIEQGVLVEGAAPEPRSRAQREAAQLVDVLGNRLGRQRVLRAEAVDTHVPEKSFRLKPAAEKGGKGYAPASAGDRPSVLLEHVRPLDVTAMRPEGPVLQIGPQRVTVCIGPERITPRWWRSSGEKREGGPPVRDYYKLQLADGRWLWAFRELSSGRWYGHGAWA